MLTRQLKETVIMWKSLKSTLREEQHRRLGKNYVLYNLTRHHRTRIKISIYDLFILKRNVME